ncbi:DUF1674 domain-containing protein [bacterium]|nr:DUF1674 domain-containing protein [bacterium]
MTSSSKTGEKPQVTPDKPVNQAEKPQKSKEYGGPKGPEPTRYGTWEKNGIEVDF